jgi:hypothetical protein
MVWHAMTMTIACHTMAQVWPLDTSCMQAGLACAPHLGNQGAIDNDACTSIKVQASAVTAALVGVQVHTSGLGSIHNN